MITINADGNPISADFINEIQSDSPRYVARLCMHGEPLDCAIKSITITKGSCGSSESFSVGNVVTNMLVAELLKLSAEIKGEDIEVQIGMNTGSEIEWITIGRFVAVEVLKTVYSTNITGYGFSIARAGDVFIIPEILSLANIASAISVQMGCEVSFDAGINTAIELYGPIESMTCYEGLQLLAHVCGGYATDTNDGRITIRRYSSTPTVSVDTSRMRQLPNIEELPFEVTGVEVIVSEADPDADPPIQETRYTSGDPVVLIDSNPNMSEQLFDYIYSGIVGYAYRTGTIDLTLGDPRIEGNDVLSVTDADGSIYIVPCHMVTHSYTGGLSTTVQAVKATSDSSGIHSVAPISQQIREIDVSTQIAKASAERAFNYAEEAKADAAEANTAATEAKEDAAEANTAATQAKKDAFDAHKAANDALTELSTVEDVVGTVTWAAEHSGQDMADYINSHLALTPYGLDLVLDNTSYRIHIGTHTADGDDGVYVIDDEGHVVSFFGEDIKFDSDHAQYIGNNNAYIVFDPTGNSGQGSLTIGGSSIQMGNKTLDEVLSNTLIYDHTYEYVRDSNNKPVSANFTAFLYRGGVDVKTEYPAANFTWYLKKEEKGTGTVTETLIGSGYACTVNLADCGYGAEVIGKFTLIDDANALSTNGDNLTNSENENLSVRATGDSVRVRDLSTSSTIFPTDKLMIVGAEDEHLVTMQTLQDYLNANLNKQVLFDTTANWDSQTSLVSDANTLYIYTDHKYDSDGNKIAGIKVGDGLAYVVDLPFTDAIATEHIIDNTRHITQTERDFWNNKVRCYYAGTEQLIFTTA